MIGKALAMLDALLAEYPDNDRLKDSCSELARRHPRLLAHSAALSRAWSNLGSFYWGENRFEEAESTYANALRINEESVHDFPEERGLRIRPAHCHQSLADTRAKLKRPRKPGKVSSKRWPSSIPSSPKLRMKSRFSSASGSSA